MRRVLGGAFALGVIASIAFACGRDDNNNATAGAQDAGVDSSALDDGAGGRGDETVATAVDWNVSISIATPAGNVSSALLGHYDLSGSLFAYDKIPGLSNAMKAVAMQDWRVGVGRWEVSTELLPTLTDGSACTSPLPTYVDAPPGATDLTVATARDWFVDDGQPVTLAATAIDARYSLAYVRSVLDVADAFGAKPLLNIDHMPRAFAQNKTFTRVMTVGDPTPCSFSWTNGVSNCCPEDAYLASTPTTLPIFPSAIVGLVKRIVEGGGDTPDKPRAVTDFELWNEPDLPYAWDPAYDSEHAKYFQTMVQSLILLDAYRTQSGKPALHFGLGSFAQVAFAIATLRGLDTGTVQPPVDFFSFHSYSNDPLAIVADITKMIAERDASTHYKAAKLLLTEWGVDLSTPPNDALIDNALLVATVIALGATAGLDGAYHSLFYDFVPGLPFGLVDHDAKPKALYRAYELLAPLLGTGGSRFRIAGADDGRFENGQGAALAVKDSSGKMRVLLVNRNTTTRTARFTFTSDAPLQNVTATSATTFDDPSKPTHALTVGDVVTLPARSITLFEL